MPHHGTRFPLCRRLHRVPGSAPGTAVLRGCHPLPPPRGCGIRFASTVPGRRRLRAPFPAAHILASTGCLGRGRGTRNGSCTLAAGCPWRGPQPVPARLARVVTTWHAHTHPFTLLVHGPDVQVWAGPAGRPAWARPALSCRMLGRRDQLDRDVSRGPLWARVCTPWAGAVCQHCRLGMAHFSLHLAKCCGFSLVLGPLVIP